MCSVARNQRALAPESYWRARNTELSSQFAVLCDLLAQSQTASTAVKQLWTTSYTNTPQWQAAVVQAKRLAQNAKRQKTRVRKLCADDLDTLRIRPNYVSACSQDHRDLIARVRQYIDVIEAMGY